MTGSITISEAAFRPDKLLKDFTNSAKGPGAIASFTGLVRADQGTQSLTLSHYKGFTDSTIKAFADKALDRWALQSLSLIHI